MQNRKEGCLEFKIPHCVDLKNTIESKEVRSETTEKLREEDETASKHDVTALLLQNLTQKSR